jgi:hypothetical protein
MIYKKSADKFIKPLSYFNKAYKIKQKETEAEDEDEEEGGAQNQPTSPMRSHPPVSHGDPINLLDLPIGTPEAVPAHAQFHPLADAPEVFELDNLEEHFELDDETFQERWSEMPHE